MQCGLSMKTNTHEMLREDRGRILFPRVWLAKTWIPQISMADNAITRGGIEIQGSPF